MIGKYTKIKKSNRKEEANMCTAATYKSADFYMGRTLDYEFSYGEEITVMPRRYPLAFRHGGKTESHYAIIGMAHVADDYPLYYDAVNEKGLGMAGLNFVGNAVYAEPEEGKQNVAQYEFIPWLLSQCATLDEARSRLSKMNLTGTPFSGQLPSAQLHWIIADATGAIVVESMADGLHIYENPTGVLTNNPPFLQQLFALNNYMHLSAKQPGECIFRSNSADDLQPRYGCARAAGRPFFHVTICTGRVYESTFRLRTVRGGECGTVFPYFGLGRSAAWLL